MILERIAAYVLAVVCIFQALRPSLVITPQCCRSIDIRIGWLRVRADNQPNPIFFGEQVGKKQGMWSSEEQKISLLRGGLRTSKSLRLYRSDSGWMMIWLDGDSRE
jgi:hypothetical protein